MSTRRVIMSSPSMTGGYSPSSGGGSVAGTPQDLNGRTQTFSPEIVRGSVAEGLEFFGRAAYDATDSPAVAAQGQVSASKDPFTELRVKSEQKLSATASAFQPFGLQVVGSGMNYPMVVSSGLQSPDAQLNKTPRGLLAKSSAQSSILASPSSPTSSHSSGITQLGTFSTDSFFTRILYVRSASTNYSMMNLALVEASVKEAIIPNGTIKYVRFGCDIMIRFSDINDAIGAYNYARAKHLEWSIEYVSVFSYTEKIGQNAATISAHEGQVLMVASYPLTGSFDRAKIEGALIDALAIEGVIYAYQKQLAAEAGTLRFVIEYCDVDAAVRAVKRLNGSVIQGIKICMTLHQPDLRSGSASRRAVAEDQRQTNDEIINTLSSMSFETLSLTQQPTGQSHYPAVATSTGRPLLPTHYPVLPSYPSLHHMGYVGALNSSGNSPIGYVASGSQFSSQYAGMYGQPSSSESPDNLDRGLSRRSHWNRFGDNGWVVNNHRRQNYARGGGRHYYGGNYQSSQHNVVDIGRIRDGIDVRTTIMLRNIPNKVDQETLKSIVDETSRGCYDFMYLRIDFANSCNVGYAFINFDDPWHIIDFVTARAGQRWNRFSSDKVAEVSYATIQGKDCLIQKFRNSSVMLENPSYRPKIFFTADHPSAGEEDTFPLPDNPSKMRRSVENAEHVGLFAPRSGHRARDDQRDHRGQYDRGTRLAALEEFEYENAMEGSYYRHRY